MSDTLTIDSSSPGCVPVETVRPDSAFTAVSYHFGMLLGVEDFETEQGYHRGKMRLHNGWLHGAGVVWGFRVSADVERGELRVSRGLAIDPAGRELYLPVDACLDVGKWYASHAADRDLTAVAEEDADEVIFPAHVELRYCECPARQVPAIADPCEGAERDTAYSRLQETVEIRLVPGPGAVPALTHPLLRILFGLSEADAGDPDQKDASDLRAAVLAVAPEARAATLLGAFRDLAARDTAGLAPPAAAPGAPLLTRPAPDDAPLVIAELPRVQLVHDGGEFVLGGGTVVNMARRASLISTATIQELLCGLFQDGGDGSPLAAEDVAAASGPRGIAGTFSRSGKRVEFKVDRPLLPASVGKSGFVAAVLGASAWSSVAIESASVAGDGVTVTVELRSSPGSRHLRLVARGTGATPLLGEDLAPLAGSTASPPDPAGDGRDFVMTES